ncbi:MAG: 50S ribosomal protein L30 [Candidatus Ancillula sp.]|jgi:large subunit ribosomal protein L30|nr:50S ribosomal protein L30 [Candidatus Ancillula sp.]
MAKLKITQVKSAIGRKPNQELNLRSLGLKHIGDSVIQEDSPNIKGMINAVSHLVTVEESK